MDSWAQLESHEQCPANFTPPTGRHDYALEYDPINQLVWMFGGSGSGCHGKARTAGKGTLPNVIVDHTLTPRTFDFYKDWTVSVNGTTANVVAYNPWSRILFLNSPLVLAPRSQYFLYPQRGGGTFSYSPVTKSWSSLTGAHWGYTGPHPGNRLSPAMAYSARDTAMVMFGGEGRNDTWALDSEAKSWVQKISSQAPGSRPGLAQLTNSMVYDRSNDVFIQFGGCRCTGESGPSSGETWAYRLSTNTWTKMTPAVSPPPRQGHNLVYDSTNKVVVLFGGFDAPSARYYNDLWVYSYPTNTWTQVVPSMSPPGRRGGAMVYDPVHQRSILYGGTSHASFQDVWALQLQGPIPGSPAPALTSLSQNSAMAGGSPFTLAVTGANFVASTAVRWNGVSRPTTYVRSTQLQASISATDIASVGTAQVSVTTPAPGGGSSNALPFAVTAPLPAPTLTSINPTTVAAGGGAFTLTATGTNFAGTSVLRINGSNRATTVVSVTQLTTTIVASDVAAAGALSISVLTPAPGGGTSAGRTLTVSAAASAVSTPSSAVSAPAVPPGGSVTAPVTLSLVFNGMLRDRVGQGVTATGSDGAMDGTLTATLSAGRTVTALRLDSDQPGAWVTGQNAAKNWVLGVALSLDGSLLNAPNTMAVNLPVSSGGSFVVFAADYLNKEFVPGAKLTLVATFSDGSTATASTTVAKPPLPPTPTSAGQILPVSGPAPAVSAAPVPSGSTVTATVPNSTSGSTNGTGLVPVGTTFPSSLPGSAQNAPAGTWATIPNTAVIAAMPPEAISGELGGAVTNLFAYSGGDLATINGVLGLVLWGGGHHDSSDNSLYFVPVNGSGPRRLSGPFLIPPGGDYYPSDGLDAYTVPSRNQPGLTTGGAPKARHTYACLTTIQHQGRPHFFTVGGGMASLGGHGTNVARLFDLTQSYAEAMARPDMGWTKLASAPWGTLSCSVGWDPVKGVVIARMMNNWSTYNPTTNTWRRLQDSAGGSDYEGNVAMDIAGRKMYVLGGMLAEVIDLDTYVVSEIGWWEAAGRMDDPNAYATGPAWAKPLITPAWRGGYLKGPGIAWHPERKRVLVYGQYSATTGRGQDIIQIDPVTGTIEVLKLGGLTVQTQPDFSILGRFRLLPGTDTVILAGTTSTNIFIGQLPATGTPTPSMPVSTLGTPTPPTPVSTPLPVSTPTAALPPPAAPNPLMASTPSPSAGVMLDVPTTLTPVITPNTDGTSIVVVSGGTRPVSFASGTTAAHYRVKLHAQFLFRGKPDATSSILIPYGAVALSTAGRPDTTGYQWRGIIPGAYDLTATLEDSTGKVLATSGQVNLTVVAPAPSTAPSPSSPVPSPAPPPSSPVPTPAPPPPPSSGAPSPGTVRVKPDQAIPLRQWVERPGPTVITDVCNHAANWDAGLCNAPPPGKHMRMFYHAPSKSMVLAGGDRPVSSIAPAGYNDCNGTEILSINVATDKTTVLRRLAVPGEPQPARPDNVGWAYDSKRNRAIMTPGYYCFFPSSLPPLSIDGWGGYAFDFATNKFNGPDKVVGLPEPPVGGGGGSWGGDNGASFSVYDPVTDELVRLRTGPRMERLNLATQTWRMIEPMTTATIPYARWNPDTNRSQPAIDIQGRAVYWLDVFSEWEPDGSGGERLTGKGWLVRTSLVDGSSTHIRLPDQTATKPGWVPVEGKGNDLYLAFDPINRVVLIPNSFGMGATPLSGLGLYFVDTQRFEWETVPAEVAGSVWGFDENLGVLVGMGKRWAPYGYYLYKVK